LPFRVRKSWRCVCGSTDSFKKKRGSRISVRMVCICVPLSPLTAMPVFYIEGQGHTLASALRAELEASAAHDEIASCTLVHHLDTHLEVRAGSERTVRTALLSIKEKVSDARAAAALQFRAAPPPAHL
jgi:DNA-directed RNA polymerase subunit L